jgi:hypothetical protein
VSGERYIIAVTDFIELFYINLVNVKKGSLSRANIAMLSKYVVMKQPY